MSASLQKPNGQLLIDQAVFGQKNPQGPSSRRQLSVGHDSRFILHGGDPQGHHHRLEQLRLLHRLQQVRGDPHFLALGNVARMVTGG